MIFQDVFYWVKLINVLETYKPLSTTRDYDLYLTLALLVSLEAVPALQKLPYVANDHHRCTSENIRTFDTFSFQHTTQRYFSCFAFQRYILADKNDEN